MLKFTVVLLLIHVSGGDESKSGKDSYLKAYAQTKILNEKSDHDGYYPEQQGYPQHPGYPEPHYEKPYYGPPRPDYGPPEYHPPPNYGPPPQQNYGPPNQFIPYALLGILDKIKYKIDLLTIGKIILKLVIFKKIISFIGIICLLLFIPSLKKKHFGLGALAGGHNDDDFRSLNSHADDKNDSLMSFVTDAIDQFSKMNDQSTR